MQKFYPASQISRSLNPDGRSLATVVARHDRRITDADINLIQDLQDQKRTELLSTGIFSGCLSYSPFKFNTSQANYLEIPAFSVVYNGEVVQIGGWNSGSLQTNVVNLPPPSYWVSGQSANDSTTYVIYLELWSRYLDEDSGSGYYVDPQGSKWLYPNGCIGANTNLFIPDDVLDPFEGITTTCRAQNQWALRAVATTNNYDFNTFPTGLDVGSHAGEVMYGQAFQVSPVQVPGYEFVNMGTINGDFGLWRSGIGSNSALGTVDGYTYAMPVAVAFQMNVGKYDIVNNPLGCGTVLSKGSGLIANGLSGRPDNKFADVTYPEAVIDTRMVTKMDAEDDDVCLNRGFSDLVTGLTALKVSRGDGVGAKTSVVGSQLPYTVMVAPNAVANTDYLGKFDGFMNGFSSDARVFFVTKQFTVNQKSSGVQGQRWAKGDLVQVVLDDPNNPVRSGAAILSVIVQAAVTQTDGSKQGVLLYTGQINISGLGTRSLSISFNQDLTGTPYDPGLAPLYLTLGVSYPASGGFDLRVAPKDVSGGVLFDNANSANMQVFGVSDYAVSKNYLTTANNGLDAYNPNYSSFLFGTIYTNRLVHSASGVRTVTNGNVTTLFSLPRTGLLGKYTGLYVVNVFDVQSGTEYAVTARSMDANNVYVAVQADFSNYNTGLRIGQLLYNTVQLSYNAPVRGVTSLEETVVVGAGISPSLGLQSDPRVTILSVKYQSSQNVILLGASNCTIKGVGGYNSVRFIYVADSSNTTYTAYALASVQVFNGVVTITMPNDSVNLENRSWFLAASLLPAPDAHSSLTLTSNYIPYQGEGISGRSYNILYSDDYALVTTNGTGAAPVPGITDVFPFNRELPLSPALPSQISWRDSDLANQSLSAQFGSNYEAKRQFNIENVIKVPLYTNDFIEPLTGWKRKTLTLQSEGGRGFSSATPHTGFAIQTPTPKSVLGSSVLSTSGPIVLYVSNTTGKDSNDGLSPLTPKVTLQAALAVLPPVLRHPVTIYLMDTGVPYLLSQMFSAGTISAAVMGSGINRGYPKHYCVFNLAFNLQEAGRLLISNQVGASNPVEISGLGVLPQGDGPVSAFVVSDSRAQFHEIKFTNFVDPALAIMDSDVELSNCVFASNIQAAELTEGSGCILNGGEINLPAGGTGFVLSEASLYMANVKLTAANSVNAFVVATMNSDVTLSTHTLGMETGVTNSTRVVNARLNSTVVCDPNFTTMGSCDISTSSVLSSPTSIASFQGGVTSDASSVVSKVAS